MTVEGFVLQSSHKFYIDNVPNAEPATDDAAYVRVGAGLSSFDPQWNEGIDQTFYLDGDGHGSSDVTSAQLVIAFEGHRKYGDPAQDFIASLQSVLGEGRKTFFRWEDPNGDAFKNRVTIANIVGASGAANEKSVFSFEVHFNGKPTLVPATPEPPEEE